MEREWLLRNYGQDAYDYHVYDSVQGYFADCNDLYVRPVVCRQVLQLFQRRKVYGCAHN